jgi:hypothetical protein
MNKDCTIIYSTAHKIPDKFRERILKELYKSAGDYPVVEQHSIPEESSITNYYNRLLEVAREIPTPYIAFAEDDTLYPDEHFNQRPSDLQTFAYNITRWNLYTWSEPPFFSLRQRKILATLIAPREEFIKVMTKRLENPDESQMVEPGRRDGEKSETFGTYNPIVVFTHPNAHGYMGGKKRADKIRATALPMWGSATKVRGYYGKS